MKIRFFLPTRVFFEEGCVRKNAQALAMGKKALIVTGHGSAKRSGALDDVTAVLESRGIQWALFDRVESNPSIATVREGARMANEEGADFIIGIGGGSPMDASKAIALLARQPLADDVLFTGHYGPDVLPVAAVPTTAGTGSEVTPYAVLMDDGKHSKSSIGTPLLFPRVALLDPGYTATLPARSTVNTAVDALSHAVEGMLSVRADALSDLPAAEAARLIFGSFDALRAGMFDSALRGRLLYASMLAGMVIAQTGTTVVHSMGYSLTYFHGIDHGRANGLLLPAYLCLVERRNPGRASRVFGALGVPSADTFRTAMERLLGSREPISRAECEAYADIAQGAKNVRNSAVPPTRQEIFTMFAESFGV